MLEHFDYETYEKLLELLRKKNVNVCFEDFPLDDDSIRYFILRHDIDFSPEVALKMAEFEAKIGVRATYFVLLNSPFYNVLSEEYFLFPRRLIELGHYVGLHYDLKIYEKIDGCNPSDVFMAHIKMLTKLTGKKVKSIAIHNPGTSGEDPFYKNKEFICAYDDKYIKDIVYLSDSCGAWRDEAIDIFKFNNIPPRLQLLIHPLYWNKRSSDRWFRLNWLIENKISNLRSNALLIREMWSQHSGVFQHEKRVHWK